jgi:hypothetical protein
LFSAPQHSQLKTFLSVPLLAGSRFPQSVQNTKEPIAAMLLSVLSSLKVRASKLQMATTSVGKKSPARVDETLGLANDLRKGITGDPEEPLIGQ